MRSSYTPIEVAKRTPELLAGSFRFPVLSEAPSDSAINDEKALYYLNDHFEFIDENGVVHKFSGPLSDLCISAKGAIGAIKCSETLLSALSGGTATATGLFPAKVLQLGVVARVVTLITGATTFDIGDGSDQDRYANDIPLTANTQTTFVDATADPRGWSATAGNVVLTANGSSFTAGAVRLTAFYMDFVGPTS